MTTLLEIPECLCLVRIECQQSQPDTSLFQFSKRRGFSDNLNIPIGRFRPLF